MPLVERIPAILLAGLMMSSCSGFDAGNEAKGPDKAAIAARKAKAKNLTRKGDLAAALVQWQILETVDRSNSANTKKRRALEAKIKKRAAIHYERGRKALSKRKTKSARQAFLATLALDPGHEDAIEQLRTLELRRVRRNRPKIATPDPKPGVPYVAVQAAKSNKPSTAERQASPKKATPAQAPATPRKSAAAPAEVTSGKTTTTAAKIDTETKASDASNSEALQRAMGLAEKGAYLDSIPHLRKHLSEFPKDTKAQNLLAMSHREVGIALYNNGDLRESLSHLEASSGFASASDAAVAAALADAKDRLAKTAYENGIRVFRSDVKQAIAYWEETLNYDPAHAKAKSYLARAYKIQETLNSLAKD